MKPYITKADIPVGYTVPKFPALTMQFKRNDFSSEYLFYTIDIWKFTLYWTLIIFFAFYCAAGVIAAVCQRRFFSGIAIIVVYMLWGLFQAFFSGSIVGLLLAAVYKSGSLTMNTWVPLIWGIAQILYVVVLSYSVTSVIL